MENFTKTIERLAHYVESKGISLNKFSVGIGVSNSYFSKMIKNKASVGSDIIEKIVSMYPDLNTEWLFSGKGSMTIELGEGKVHATNLPSGPCQQCEQRERIISSQQKNIELLEEKIEVLRQGHKRAAPKNDSLKETG